jgi:hypothetical protein
MSRAGYIPQMFSLRLPNPLVIFELLQKAGARALVCEPSFCVDLSGCPVSTYSAIQVREQGAADAALPPIRTDYPTSDIAFIFHTSGSTNGSPKLVPCNRRWLNNIVTKSKQLARVHSTRGQDVTVAMYGDPRNCFALIFDLTFVSCRFTGEVCVTSPRHSVSDQRLPFLSLNALISVSLSSVDRLAVPWVVYHSTHSSRILLRRVTRHDYSMRFEPPQAIRSPPRPPPPQLQDQPEAPPSPRSARRSHLQWTCSGRRGRGLGFPKWRQSSGKWSFDYHTLAPADEILSPDPENL